MSNSVPNLRNLAALMPPPILPDLRYAPTPQSAPPVYPQHALAPGGPNVHVPSAWNKSPQSAPPAAPPGSGQVMALPLGSSGYGAQHLHYAAQRDHWARVAHHAPPAETISLEISAVFEAGAKKRNIRANNIGVSVAPYYLIYCC